MDRDVKYYERQVYSFFMLLGDIGGVYGLSISIGATVLGFLNYNKSKNILASSLYNSQENLNEQLYSLEAKK